MDFLETSLKISSSGLAAQSARLRIVSENMANAQSTGKTPGSDPYVRKTISFTSELDRASGANLVKISSFGFDRTPFNIEHDPGNPAANAAGEVKTPNVNLLVELADMREANRAYEANLQVIKQTKDLYGMTIDLLKGV
jgi:flagellar basal-body rod protein FlgC